MSYKDIRLDRGVYFVPTITAGRSVADSAKIAGYYVPVVTQKALEIGPIIQGTFAKAYQAGVPIAFGTDAGVFKHGRNAKNFREETPVVCMRMSTVAKGSVNRREWLQPMPGAAASAGGPA